ncbi:9186_t:CDS:2, partial [Paraglomus brasilianum]
MAWHRQTLRPNILLDKLLKQSLPNFKDLTSPLKVAGIRPNNPRHYHQTLESFLQRTHVSDIRAAQGQGTNLETLSTILWIWHRQRITELLGVLLAKK